MKKKNSKKLPVSTKYIPWIMAVVFFCLSLVLGIVAFNQRSPTEPELNFESYCQSEKTMQHVIDLSYKVIERKYSQQVIYANLFLGGVRKIKLNGQEAKLVARDGKKIYCEVPFGKNGKIQYSVTILDEGVRVRINPGSF